ncbi:MAG TPA: alpha/beta hydrolase [Microbacteriaceae bacterium]|nr:alpha/beta hydrolase [Microbacteriaceae bacterium]
MPYFTGPHDMQVYYEEFGRGPTVLFISPTLSTHGFWEDQVHALSTDHRTVTFDWPGSGLSDKPNVDYGYELAVDALSTLIGLIDPEDLTVVAEGVGSHLGILLAERHPDIVKRLAVISGGPWMHGMKDGKVGGLPEEFLLWVAATRTNDLPVEYYTNMVERFYFLETPSPELVRWVVDDCLRWPMHVFRCYSDSMDELDHRERAARIQQPVLVMHGRHDLKQRYEGAVLLADLLPNGRLHTFERSAHMPNLEEKIRFNEALRAFIHS